MGRISTGVGLISGLDIQALVKQLMALESRPLEQVKGRIAVAQRQGLAYAELNARFLAAKGAVHRLAQPAAFTVKKVTSSNPEALTATASENAATGNFTFMVKSLVTTHQIVSKGFTDRTATPVGPGTLTFEVGKGNVAPSTLLADLNGVEGVRRGVVRIVDRSGGVADVDLRSATTIDEVLEAINSQATARVRASVDGDRLVITDMTALTTGLLTVSDIGTGFAAQDLGIVGSSSSGQIAGLDVMNLADGTSLAILNDDNGVRISGVGSDLRFTLSNGGQVEVNLSGLLRFETQLAEVNDGRGVRLGTVRITNRMGASQEIDLSAAVTVQDVVTAINGSGLSVAASLSGSKIALSDTSGGIASNLKIEDVSGFAAADLGILTDTNTKGFTGATIYRVNTVGGVLRAVQYATNNNGMLAAAISADGNGITFTDQSGGGGTAIVEAMNNSKALQDLGLAAGFNGTTLQSRPLLAGMNTVLLSSLNGGSGVDTASLTITREINLSNVTETIDVSQAKTLQDVITAINGHLDVNSQPMFQAQVGAGGTSITIKDVGGGRIVNFGGATADDLHLSVNIDNTVQGGDLQLRYISENTLLASLHGGEGISYGKFRVMASNGTSGVVTLRESLDKTIGDVIKQINGLDIGVTAQINANGDGIELVDTAGGAVSMSVAEDGTTSTARNLGILGTATAGTLTGTFASSIEIDNDDTLDALVAKINAAGAGVKASVINDGSSSAPYRLILTSEVSGSAGEINYSTGGSGLSFNMLSEARDAKIVIGDPNSPNALVMTSSSNTVKNLIEGVTLQLNAASDAPVQVGIQRDLDQVVTDVKTFVSTFNSALDRIDELIKFIPDTKERGILLGDSTILRVRDRLYSRLSATFNGNGRYQHLSQVGLTVGQGARVRLDEERFREAFAADPEAVKELFTLVTTDEEGKKTTKVGLAARLEDELNAITQAGEGVFAQQQSTIKDKVELFNTRVTEMQKLLDQKEARLLAQFQNMEKALSSLQGQQSALSSLAGLSAAFSKRQ